MRLGDLDALYAEFEKAAWYNNADRDEVAESLLLDAPTIDAVPVVRCKDCKHYHAELGWCDEHSHFIDEDSEFCYPHESTEWKMFYADYFCADGERKDGEG